MTTIFGNNYSNIAAAGETPIYQRTGGGGTGGGYTLGPTINFPADGPVEFTNIPNGVTTVKVILNSLYLSGGGYCSIQIGDSNGFDSALDYISNDFTTLNAWSVANEDRKYSGIIRLEKFDSYTWAMEFSSSRMREVSYYGNDADFIIGRKTLSGTLDRIKVFGSFISGQSASEYAFSPGSGSGSASISYI